MHALVAHSAYRHGAFVQALQAQSRREKAARSKGSGKGLVTLGVGAKWYATPSTAKNAANETHAVIQSLNNDIEKEFGIKRAKHLGEPGSEVRNKPFYDAWTQFVNDWIRAYNETGFPMWWAGYYETAIDFRKRAKVWREKFIELGGKPITPEIVIPKEESLIPWDKIFYVFLAIIGAFVIIAVF